MNLITISSRYLDDCSSNITLVTGIYASFQLFMNPHESEPSQYDLDMDQRYLKYVLK
jgi:hypothetical protein